MLYDSYFLHLETSDRDAVDQACKEFERTARDILLRSSELKAEQARWRPCFKLTLTEVWNHPLSHSANVLT